MAIKDDTIMLTSDEQTLKFKVTSEPAHTCKITASSDGTVVRWIINNLITETSNETYPTVGIKENTTTSNRTATITIEATTEKNSEYDGQATVSSSFTITQGAAFGSGGGDLDKGDTSGSTSGDTVTVKRFMTPSITVSFPSTNPGTANVAYSFNAFSATDLSSFNDQCLFGVSDTSALFASKSGTYNAEVRKDAKINVTVSLNNITDTFSRAEMRTSNGTVVKTDTNTRSITGSFTPQIDSNGLMTIDTTSISVTFYK